MYTINYWGNKKLSFQNIFWAYEESNWKREKNKKHVLLVDESTSIQYSFPFNIGMS